MNKDPPLQNTSGVSSTRQNTALRSREDLMALSASSPVKDVKTAKAYLTSKSWCLKEEKITLSKISRILLSVLLIKNVPAEAQAVVKAIALIVEDSDADTFAELIAAKTTALLTSAISNTTDFLSAASKDCADTLIKTKDILQRAEDLTLKLDSSPPFPSHPAPSPTWAQVTSNSTAQPILPAPPTSLAEIKIQQRMALAARRILLELDPNDPLCPKDRSTEPALRFRDKINLALASLPSINGRRPAVKAASALENRGYLLEATDPATIALISSHTDILANISPSIRIQQQSFSVVLRFVPCNSDFDPNTPAHLQEIADEAEIPLSTILSASWVKPPHLRSPNQSFANLKISLSTPVAANALLVKRIRIRNHLTSAHKDLKEPTRCNKCQRFGHKRASCPGNEVCATCTSSSHPSHGCSANNTPSCVNCGPSSQHPSHARTCPVFMQKQTDLNARLPENTLPFFPTQERWTWSSSQAPMPPPPSSPLPVHPSLPTKPKTFPSHPRRTLRQTTLTFPPSLSLHPTAITTTCSPAPPSSPPLTFPPSPDRSSTPPARVDAPSPLNLS